MNYKYSDQHNIIHYTMSFLSRSTQESGCSQKDEKQEEEKALKQKLSRKPVRNQQKRTNQILPEKHFFRISFFIRVFSFFFSCEGPPDKLVGISDVYP